MILSKQFFNLFHAYARKNNMWILDQPLSPQLPDLLLDLMFMRYIVCILPSTCMNRDTRRALSSVNLRFRIRYHISLPPRKLATHRTSLAAEEFEDAVVSL